MNISEVIEPSEGRIEDPRQLELFDQETGNVRGPVIKSRYNTKKRVIKMSDVLEAPAINNEREKPAVYVGEPVFLAVVKEGDGPFGHTISVFRTYDEALLWITLATGSLPGEITGTQISGDFTVFTENDEAYAYIRLTHLQD